MSLDQPRFTISPSPFANATHGLFLDLARQAFPEYLASLPDHEVTTLLKGGAISRNEHGSLQIGIWTHKEIISYMRELLGKNSPSDGLSLTIITTPSTADNNAHTTDFGTYSMPSNTRQSLLHSKRQQPSESPLEEEPTVQPTTANTSPLTTLASSVDPLPGILPACFSSQSACESTTRNCSGHGVCGKKYTDKSAEGDSKFKDCYACECKATKRDMGEGKVQTTYWGGPACQKKDVSVQFWLIALFSVAMVGLVSFAVGTVWSMGDEELPSVIGAGVSGPVRRS